jgi:hypothetical protein
MREEVLKRETAGDLVNLNLYDKWDLKFPGGDMIGQAEIKVGRSFGR